MKIFLAGDAVTGTGPANVTQYYIENLLPGVLYQKCRNKVFRAVEIVWRTLQCDVAVYSGYSKQNILGMKIAKILGKPTAYLMHGCVEYENEINSEADEEMCRVERLTMQLSDLILAVSPSFAKWITENYTEYADKVDYITNAIDDSLLQRVNNNNACDNNGEHVNGRNVHNVMSIGGGMPRKKIKYICEAVRILREEADSELTLTVVGAVGADSDIINSYDFVDNRGLVPFEECLELLRHTGLFVQNSCFETFGLAPVEAIASGCPTLCSKEVGALCLIDGITDMDIIYKYDDPKEIAQKIQYLLHNSNSERLVKGIDWESNTWKRRSETLVEKLSALLN